MANTVSIVPAKYQLVNIVIVRHFATITLS